MALVKLVAVPVDPGTAISSAKSKVLAIILDPLVVLGQLHLQIQIHEDKGVLKYQLLL